MAESPRIIELQQKFEDNPRRYFASLANEYRKAGDFQRAISICRIYLEKQPAHTPGHVVLGQALYAGGKVEEAAESFTTVLGIDPENLIALKCLGDIARINGNLELARDNFRKVLTADPRDHEASGQLKAVEQELKVAAHGGAEEWIPPRSDEFAVLDEPPPVFATNEYVAEVEPEPVAEATEVGAAAVEAVEATIAEPPTAEPEIVEAQVVETAAVEANALSMEDIYESGDLPTAAPDDSPHLSLEIDNLPALEAPVFHEDVPEDDFLDTLLPSEQTEHQSSIAEAVEPESAEELLSVPDLMEEVDVPPAASFGGGEEFQYRTAEFVLPNFGSMEPEPGATSMEMESEAGALMDEAESSLPAPAPAIEDYDPMLQQARTGEYSLSRDTGEWQRELDDTFPRSTPADVEQVDEVAPVEPAGPFITETVAELYLQQGFTGEALLVYRQLARSKPNDQRIADRIAELEQRLSDEHVVRQASLENPLDIEEPTPEPFVSEPEPTREIHLMDSVEFEMAPPPPPPPPAPRPVAIVEEPDDWFANAPVPPARARQTVQDFFAVLGRAKAEVRRKPERNRVSADDIRAAADITAGFGAFGTEPASQSPKPIAAPARGDGDPEEDVRRFRSWLDGLSDS